MFTIEKEEKLRKEIIAGMDNVLEEVLQSSKKT